MKKSIYTLALSLFFATSVALCMEQPTASAAVEQNDSELSQKQGENLQALFTGIAMLAKVEQDKIEWQKTIGMVHTACEKTSRETKKVALTLIDTAQDNMLKLKTLIVTINRQLGSIEGLDQLAKQENKPDKKTLAALAKQVPAKLITTITQAEQYIQAIESNLHAAGTLAAAVTNMARPATKKTATPTTTTTAAVSSDEESDKRETKTPKPTQWQGEVPRLVQQQPAPGIFASIRNWLWPQLPTLAVVTQRETIDAKRNTAAQVDQAVATLYTPEMRSTIKIENYKTNPAKAYKLITAAQAATLRSTYHAYKPKALIDLTSRARGWRLSLVAALSLGRYVNRTLSTMRLNHTAVLAAPCALAGYFVFKPLLTSLCRAGIERFNQATLTTNKAVRKEYWQKLKEAHVPGFE